MSWLVISSYDLKVIAAIQTMEGLIGIGARASIIKVCRTVVITMMKISNQTHCAANVGVVKLVTVCYEKCRGWNSFLLFQNLCLLKKFVKTNIVVHLQDVVILHTQYTIEIQPLPNLILQVTPMKLIPKISIVVIWYDLPNKKLSDLILLILILRTVLTACK